MNGGIMHRFLVAGEPRAGKSRVSAALCRTRGISHLPLDALVSTLADVFPEHGITHHGADHLASCAFFQPFLARLVDHLQYEGHGFVLDGYHIQPEVGSQFMGRGFRVIFLGYEEISTAEKCSTIRATARPGDWTEPLSDDDLSRLVDRFKAESARLRSECLRLEVPYLDMGAAGDDAVELAVESLTHP